MAEGADRVLEDLEAFAKDGGKGVVICSGAILLAFILGHLLHKWHVSWLPESLVVVGLGALVGLALPSGSSHISHWTVKHFTIREESVVNEVILNWFLLPMIIFEAGWSMQHRNFISQLPYINLFAIFGTLISMGVVTSLILVTKEYHGVHQPRVAAAYAALISAVDPVATLSTYSHLNVDPLLHTVVFGESVINDAVAIVLFKTLNSMPADAFDKMGGADIAGKLAGGVFGLLSGSLVVGLVLAGIYCITFRVTDLGASKSLAALYVFFSCFFTYNVTESILEMSGIIAVLFAGMVMGGYCTPHMSSEGTMFTSFLLKQMSFIGDILVFFFVGIAVVYVSPNGLAFGAWVMFFCLVGRACATLPLAMLTNCIKRTVLKNRPRNKQHLLSWSHIFMMWHAGLRGGIALVLTLELGDWVDDINGIGTQEKLRNATLVLICAFLLLFGGTTEFFLNLLGIPMHGAGVLEHHKGAIMNTYQKGHKLATCLLIGSGSTRSEDAPEVVKAVLEDAAHWTADDNDDPVRAPSKESLRTMGERYDLFGSNDPCHAEEVGESRRESRRRRTASSSAIHLATLGEEDYNENVTDTSDSDVSDDADSDSGAR